MKKISTTQIKALRALHEGAHTRTIRRQTLAALARRGFVHPGGLTERGRGWISDYLEKTGDGPEDLKELFRLG